MKTAHRFIGGPLDLSSPSPAGVLRHDSARNVVSRKNASRPPKPAGLISCKKTEAPRVSAPPRGHDRSMHSRLLQQTTRAQNLYGPNPILPTAASGLRHFEQNFWIITGLTFVIDQPFARQFFTGGRQAQAESIRGCRRADVNEHRLRIRRNPDRKRIRTQSRRHTTVRRHGAIRRVRTRKQHQQAGVRHGFQICL